MFPQAHSVGPRLAPHESLHCVRGCLDPGHGVRPPTFLVATGGLLHAGLVNIAKLDIRTFRLGTLGLGTLGLAGPRRIGFGGHPSIRTARENGYRANSSVDA